MQLFDLEKDPSEKENIIHDKRYKQEVKEMTRLIRKYVKLSLIHIYGGNRTRPMSSASWTISASTPKSYIEKPGNYKIYIKYTNTDAGNDIIQYFPKHPVTRCV